MESTPTRTQFEMIAFFNNPFQRANIGDKVILLYRNDNYRIIDQDQNVIGERVDVNKMGDRLDSMISFIETKIDKRICIMDENDDFFNTAVGDVIAASKDFIAVKIEPVYKDAWFDKLDQMGEVEFVKDDLGNIEDLQEEFLKHLKDLLCVEEEPEHCRSEMCEEKKEEKKDMFSDFGNSFGKINSNQFKISINGLTVRNKEGKYVTFNPETRELIEVTTGFFDDMNDLLFLMPTMELEIGDIILHQGKPYYITSTREGNIKGIDFEDAVESVLIPKTNVFGMKYYTKVFNCLGTNNILGSDLASNPMMAYALMGGKDFDLSKLMMFQALSGQGNGIADFSENPIMLMALMSNEKGGELSDFAKMQVLSQLSSPKKRKAKETKEN